MRSEQVFALIAMILAIRGGVLLCKGAIDVIPKTLEGSGNIKLGSPALLE